MVGLASSPVAAQTWQVTPSRGEALAVAAPNWLAALGVALQVWDRPLPTAGFAVERFANGVVLARDLASGDRYVLRAAADEGVEIVIEDDEDEATASRSRVRPA